MGRFEVNTECSLIVEGKTLEEHVALPRGIKAIESLCAPNMKSVELPDTLEYLDLDAIHSDEVVEELILPDSVKELRCRTRQFAASRAFRDIKYIRIGAGLRKLNVQVLKDSVIDHMLERVDVSPENRYMTSIDGIVYSKDQTRLVYVPRGYSGEVVMPDTVTTVPAGAFEKCKVKKVVMSKHVKNIPLRCFSECQYLDEVVLPEDLETVGDHAFFNCTQLQRVELGERVWAIMSSAFWSGSLGLQVELHSKPYVMCQVSYGEYIKNLTNKTVEGILWTDIQKKIEQASGDLKEVVIPEGVKKIPEEMFMNQRELDTVELPQSCEVIGTGAFAGCTGLKRILIGPGLKRIEAEAFAGTQELEWILRRNGDDNVSEGLGPGVEVEEDAFAGSMYSLNQ